MKAAKTILERAMDAATWLNRQGHSVRRCREGDMRVWVNSDKSRPLGDGVWFSHEAFIAEATKAGWEEVEG